MWPPSSGLHYHLIATASASCPLPKWPLPAVLRFWVRKREHNSPPLDKMAVGLMGGRRELLRLLRFQRQVRMFQGWASGCCPVPVTRARGTSCWGHEQTPTCSSGLASRDLGSRDLGSHEGTGYLLRPSGLSGPVSLSVPRNRLHPCRGASASISGPRGGPAAAEIQDSACLRASLMRTQSCRVLTSGSRLPAFWGGGWSGTIMSNFSR